MSIKETVTHIGKTAKGKELLYRKNKTGGWCTLRPCKGGYCWDSIHYLFEYPESIRKISQEELGDYELVKESSQLKNSTKGKSRFKQDIIFVKFNLLTSKREREIALFYAETYYNMVWNY